MSASRRSDTIRAVSGVVVGALAVAVLWGAPPARAQDPGPLLPLVDAAAQRLQTADPVAANKFRSGGAIEDPQREQQVIGAATADAAQRHIDQPYVADAFRRQIDATVGVEYALFSHWKLEPDTAPSTAPELASSRTVIDGLNRTMVSEIAANWATLHSPACSAELADAIAATVEARGLDDLYRRALTYATGSYCR